MRARCCLSRGPKSIVASTRLSSCSTAGDSCEEAGGCPALLPLLLSLLASWALASAPAWLLSAGAASSCIFWMAAAAALPWACELPRSDACAPGTPCQRGPSSCCCCCC
eukprot:1151913-Pelagomonas_calceolata.AAC.17